MKWASSAADDATLEQAITRAAADVSAHLGGAAPDLIVAFVSPHHAAGFERVPKLIAAELGSGLLLGCSAGGVIGGGREIEQRPGVSLTAAVLPGVSIHPFLLQTESLPNPTADAARWQALVGVDAGSTPHFVILPDPYTFDAESLVRGLDRAYPTGSKIGGIASGGHEPRRQRAVPRQGDRARRRGRRGAERQHRHRHHRRAGLPPDRRADVRHQLRSQHHPRARRAAAARCAARSARSPRRTRPPARPPLAVPGHRDERQDRQEYHQGDFLIRNLLGIDPESGALAVGALLDENAVVQFHLRDARTSAQDLDEMLASYQRSEVTPAPGGALLFSCLGRGQFLYGSPDHDTDAFRGHLGDLPLGGFFCNGEIGPVHGTTFLHGYTSAFGVFRARRG